MRKIIIALLLTMTIPAISQNHFLGLKGGVTWTNATSRYLLENNYKKGFSGGVTYEYQLIKHFIIGADLLYSQKGFINYKRNADLDGYYNGIDRGSYQLNYDYLSIPIKAGVILGNKISGFLNIGVVPSFLVKAVALNQSMFELGFHNEIKESPRFVIGGLAEVGGSININTRISLFSVFTYQHSFTTITSLDRYYGADTMLYGMTLSFGLKYTLEKE